MELPFASGQAPSTNEAAQQVKLRLWSQLLDKGRQWIDLTDGHEFDWKAYMQSLPDERQHLICCGVMGRIGQVTGEIHSRAMCPWEHRPVFHFVLYDGDFRVLLSMHNKKRCTVLFESHCGHADRFYEESHSGTVNHVQTTTVIANFGTTAKAQMLTVPRQEFSTFYIINVKGLRVGNIVLHCLVLDV